MSRIEEINLYPEMNKRISDLLAMSKETMYPYAAKYIKHLEAKLAGYREAAQAGRLIVLPCETERIKQAVQRLHDSNGYLYDDISLSNDYGDCRKGCFRCVIDGLREEAEAALQEGPE